MAVKRPKRKKRKHYRSQKLRTFSIKADGKHLGRIRGLSKTQIGDGGYGTQHYGATVWKKGKKIAEIYADTPTEARNFARQILKQY